MRLRPFGSTLAVCAGLLTPPWGWAQSPCPGRPDPGINKPFEDPNVKEFIARFEDQSREVYA